MVMGIVNSMPPWKLKAVHRERPFRMKGEGAIDTVAATVARSRGGIRPPRVVGPEHPSEIPIATLRVAYRLLRLVSPALDGATMRGALAGSLSFHASRTRTLRRLLQNACSALDVEVQTAHEMPVAPLMLVSNHVSFLDPLVLGSLMSARPVAKSEIQSWPLLGRIGRETGVLFVAFASPSGRH